MFLSSLCRRHKRSRRGGRPSLFLPPFLSPSLLPVDLCCQLTSCSAARPSAPLSLCTGGKLGGGCRSHEVLSRETGSSSLETWLTPRSWLPLSLALSSSSSRLGLLPSVMLLPSVGRLFQTWPWSLSVVEEKCSSMKVVQSV
uniref:Uncharacterized protein n=1 Tax=Oryza sativa subsp. japonica TaxID=39947 RepID=Q6H448_ORYSJ|nr:hypothetical protein [Oryza sativa Japonica Group]BAD26501.1 hypothetical protein [Oryza sativa Japonica Group]